MAHYNLGLAWKAHDLWVNLDSVHAQTGDFGRAGNARERALLIHPGEQTLDLQRLGHSRLAAQDAPRIGVFAFFQVSPALRSPRSPHLLVGWKSIG